MSSTIPQAVIDQITRTKGVIASATTLINTFGTKLQSAIEAALANGATAEELAPLTVMSADLETDTAALAKAVSQNP